MNIDEARRALVPVPGVNFDQPPLILRRERVPPEPYLGWAKAIVAHCGPGFSRNMDFGPLEHAERHILMRQIMNHFRRRTAQIVREVSPLQPGATPFRVTPTAPAYNLQRYPLDELMIGAYVTHMLRVETLPGLARIVESHDRQCRLVARNPLLMEAVRTRLPNISARTWRHVQWMPDSIVHHSANKDLYEAGEGFALLRIGLNMADDEDQPTPAPVLELVVYSKRITGAYTPLDGLRVVVFRDVGAVTDLASTLMDYIFRYNITKFHTASRIANAYISTSDPRFIDRLFNPTKQVL